jgi:hypothetical protein
MLMCRFMLALHCLYAGHRCVAGCTLVNIMHDATSALPQREHERRDEEEQRSMDMMEQAPLQSSTPGGCAVLVPMKVINVWLSQSSPYTASAPCPVATATAPPIQRRSGRRTFLRGATEADSRRTALGRVHFDTLASVLLKCMLVNALLWHVQVCA